MRLKTGTIRQSVTLPATPGEVYEAYMNPKKHSAFTGARATCSPKVGGRMTAWGGYISAKNTEPKKGRKIAQEWSTSEWPTEYPPSRLELVLQKKGNGTLLKMTHSKVPSSQIESYRQGWYDSYWNPLREYLAKTEGKH